MENIFRDIKIKVPIQLRVVKKNGRSRNRALKYNKTVKEWMKTARSADLITSLTIR